MMEASDMITDTPRATPMMIATLNKSSCTLDEDIHESIYLDSVDYSYYDACNQEYRSQFREPPSQSLRRDRNAQVFPGQYAPDHDKEG